MATVIAAIIVFGLVGLDVFYLLYLKSQGKSSCSCSGGCSGGCSHCGSNSESCSCCHHS